MGSEEPHDLLVIGGALRLVVHVVLALEVLASHGGDIQGHVVPGEALADAAVGGDEAELPAEAAAGERQGDPAPVAAIEPHGAGDEVQAERARPRVLARLARPEDSHGKVPLVSQERGAQPSRSRLAQVDGEDGAGDPVRRAQIDERVIAARFRGQEHGVAIRDPAQRPEKEPLEPRDRGHAHGRPSPPCRDERVELDHGDVMYSP